MKTCVAVLLGAAVMAANAQTVHKCTVDGKVTYSDMPCAPGAAAASTLAVPAAPAADPDAARDLKRLQKDSATLEKARLKRQEKEDRENDKASQAAAIQRKKCGKLKLNKQWADEDARRATGAAADAAKLRAKRAGESMALECPH